MFLPSPLFFYHFPHRRCISGNVIAIVFLPIHFIFPPPPPPLPRPTFAFQVLKLFRLKSRLLFTRVLACGHVDMCKIGWEGCRENLEA